MIRKLVKHFALAATALLGATAAYADHPAFVRVRSLSYAGTGCPAGSVYGFVGSLNDSLTLEFDNFVAEAGRGMPLSASRKNCQISVDLEIPGGWSYAIATVDYRGYVQLSSGVTAEQKSSYYFQGSSSTASLKTTFRGPIASDYMIRDELGVNAVVWSPCAARRALNVNAQVRVISSSGRYGLMTLDSITGRIKHLYGLRWRRC